MDSETKKFLEEVKKGKPRKFVMICKGMKILSLIVYKKGVVETYRKGELHAAQPLTVCARNIRHAPIRERMQTVCRTLQYSLQDQRSENDVGSTLLELLGDIIAPQRWLVTSLDKTIRLQLEL